MVAQGIQQALMAVRSSVQPLGPVGVFNTLAILVWLALFANAGLYDSRRLLNAAEEFKLILQTVATGTVAVTFTAFVLKVPTQRSWVLATWAGCTIAVLATRFVYRWLLGSMRRSGALVSRMLIVGAGRDGRDLCRAVTRARHLGFQVVGFLDDTRPVGPAAAGLPEIVGSSAEVRQAVREYEAHAVLVAGGSVATETAERVYRDLQELPVDFHLSTGVLGVAASRVAVQRFDDVPVLGLRRVELTRGQQALKRAFDLIVASLLVVALSPIMVACALAVRLSGPGPILFRQQRFGQDGTRLPRPQVPLHGGRRRGPPARPASGRERGRRAAVQAPPRPARHPGRSHPARLEPGRAPPAPRRPRRPHEPGRPPPVHHPTRST